MSVEVIIGRAGSGKTFACLQRMRDILRSSPLQTEIIYLLPAYQTYRAELELAAITGGSINTRMYSFQRFARQILSEVGGTIVPRISEIGRRLLLRKILIARSKSKELKYYHNAAKQRGFVEHLAQELHEFRTYSIDADKLRKTIDDSYNLLPERQPDDELKNKIHDLAMLYEDFRNAIADKQNDESDLIEKAAELIRYSEAVKRSEIFIDGFIFFDPQQRKILREIFQHAKNVYITLPMDTDLQSRDNIRDVGLFNRSYKTLLMLKNIAKEVDVDIKISPMNIPRRFKSDALRFIEGEYFNRVPKQFSGIGDGFKIVEAVNKRVEVEAVARDIIRLYRDEHYRFRDIGVISRDDSYSNLFKPIFEIHGIPFFIDKKRAAAHHPLAELIRSSLDVLRGWRADAIFRCLRTGFFDVSQNEIDLLENYVLEFGLRGAKVWTTADKWHWRRHRLAESPDDEPSEEQLERLEQVDAIRRQAVKPLADFSIAIAKKKSVIELTTALYNLIDGLKVHDKLLEWSEFEEATGNLALSREHLKIWDDTVTLMEQVVESLNEDAVDAKEFELIINEGLDALEMSLIPPGLDAVTVAQFDQNSLQNSKAIYIVGFGDEHFPRKVTEKGLLSDADRLHLSDMGLEIALGGRETMFAEKFLIYRGMTEARNYLQLSYPLADSECNAMRPSTIITRLKNIFNAEVKTIHLDVLDNLGSEIDYVFGERELTAESARELFAPNKQMGGNVTKFETFNKCPFQYFAGYGLNLEERREYTVKPPDIGNILHSVMCQFGLRMKSAKRRWASVDDAELTTIVDDILDNTAPNLNNKILLSTNAYKHQAERIKAVAISSLQRLIELDRNSKFHPEIFEKSFGKNNKLIYNLGTVKMELTGTIDRVDISEDRSHFLIIDYKTGSAHLDLGEIFIGVNLQLLTYLMVADDIENCDPAGMFYYFLKRPTKTADNEEQARKDIGKETKLSGWVLDDIDVIDDIDSSKQFVSVRVTNGNEIHKGDSKKVKSAEDFSTLENFAKVILQETGKKILRGEITADPVKSKKVDACKYCNYAEMCGFNRKAKCVDRLANLDDNDILIDMKNLRTGLDLRKEGL